MKKICFFAVIAVWMSLLLDSCKNTDDFTTYYNTYWNANRLIKESEDEFDYQENVVKKQFPRAFVPEPKNIIPALVTGTPPFMKDFIISQQKRQPVEVKLDSVIIKGSKIQARHYKSTYIEGTLFLMAKAYFYKNEWGSAQIKCSELVDKFPAGELSPDAHLLMAEVYLIQQKFYQGKILLSRTIDIAWQKKRYDILSTAFRLQAELALYQSDVEAAYKPYKQAIVQSDDEEQKARWQVDLAAILFRVGRFKQAEIEFRKVKAYSPDYVTDFEASLYGASCLNRLGKFIEADKILVALEEDTKNAEWHGYVAAERLNQLRLKKKFDEMKKMEKASDSAFTGNPLVSGVLFERGMELFENNQWVEARTYFARSRATKTTVQKTGERMFNLLNQWDRGIVTVTPLLAKIKANTSLNDSNLTILSAALFELGRTHELFGNEDSTLYYYKKASENFSKSDEKAPRYLYAYARTVRKSDLYLSNSVYESIIEKYPLTEYSKDAVVQLKLEKDFVIDSAEDFYSSGDKLRKHKEFDFALKQFNNCWKIYPNHRLAPKALYSVGWIYEKNLLSFDSALVYYKLLLEKYPKSEYAADVRLSVDYLTAVRSGKTMPDSIQKKTKIDSGLKISNNPFTVDTGRKQSLSPFIADPKKIQVDPKNLKNLPDEMMKNLQNKFDNPSDMLKTDGIKNFEKALDDPGTLVDSAKINGVNLNSIKSFFKNNIWGGGSDDKDTTKPAPLVPPDADKKKEPKK
ncbi:MAG: hypothetical protein NT007_16005 [Candidatus Kapabacteria bacterium]|nr:hypothetical protein [Candidatus Kapabacteria bacterium]